MSQEAGKGLEVRVLTGSGFSDCFIVPPGLLKITFHIAALPHANLLM